MNAQVARLPTNDRPPATPTMPALSQGLSSLLMLGPRETAVTALAASPMMLDEARHVLPELKAFATEGAGPAGVRLVIDARWGLYRKPDMSAQQWAFWWADYESALEDLPEASLEAGMQAWARQPDARFMPMPGKLRELATEANTRPAEAAHRADQAVRLADQRGQQQRRGPFVGKARVDDLMKGFSDRMAQNNAHAKAGWPNRQVKP